jgi:hypothetical protein
MQFHQADQLIVIDCEPIVWLWEGFFGHFLFNRWAADAFIRSFLATTDPVAVQKSGLSPVELVEML